MKKKSGSRCVVCLFVCSFVFNLILEYLKQQGKHVKSVPSGGFLQKCKEKTLFLIKRYRHDF